MKMEANWKRLCLVALMAFACTGLYAEQMDEEEERDIAGQRVEATLMARLQSERSDQDKEHQSLNEEDEQEAEERLVVMGAYYAYSGYPREFDGSHHWPTGRSSNGDTIDLEDGSKWEVCKLDAQLTLNWELQDRIVVRANKDRLSLFTYELCNLDTDESVRANLAVGPYTNGAYTLRVMQVDYARNRVVVYDGAGRRITLSFSSFDRDAVRQWHTGDSVVVGVNDDWLGWWNPYIFINVSTLQYARGAVSVQ